MQPGQGAYFEEESYIGNHLALTQISGKQLVQGQPTGYSDSRIMLDDMDTFDGILPFHNDLLFFENCLPSPQGLSAIVVVCDRVILATTNHTR